ncbi:hypothetical protein V1520DRAFT_379353 [Lipomyces starkeyi]|uniref:Uncharacterized protein n=1 Tax=Lipomyces starkeyi NRRL Y-11557 TaxID=675824 RepID=A0A1E3PW71_LIPST|nr:hypothetical protein LIPSTDRAFT_192765 [Lipomyces starkeyi NRRL Y-11557]
MMCTVNTESRVWRTAVRSVGPGSRCTSFSFVLLICFLASPFVSLSVFVRILECFRTYLACILVRLACFMTCPAAYVLTGID